MKLGGFFLIALILGAVNTMQAVDKVKGSGTLETKEINVTDYNSIRINGVYEVHYGQWDKDEPFLEITTDDNLQQYILAEVKERVLTIGFKRDVKVEQFTKFIIKANSKWLKEANIAGNANFMVSSSLSGDEMVIKAKDNSLIQLKEPVAFGRLELDVAGSANMVINEIRTDKLECTMNGSGSITLKSGEAKEGSYKIASSGDIHAFGVVVADLKCNIAGSGLAEVHATENLKTTLVGKGTIRYKGVDPSHQTKLGKGTIEKAE